MAESSTYAVVSLDSRKKIKGRDLTLDQARNLARSLSNDFFGQFSVVDTETLKEVCAYQDGQHYLSYVTAMGGTMASIKRGHINRERAFREALAE